MSGVAAGAGGANTSSKIPVFRSLLANTGAMLTGIKRHYLRKGRKEAKVVAFAGDGATADCGFQALSGAAERGEPIVYICYDNEGYMNTGYQRSATTPPGAWTPTTPKGKLEASKDIPMIMAMHRIPYVATANPAFLEDFLSKLTRACQVEDGLAYIHLFTPCPMGWKYPSALSLEVCRLAVETNYFPLWEAERGRFRVTWKPNRYKSIDEYLKDVGKFSSLSQEGRERLQRAADERYRRLLSLEAS